MTSNIPRRYFAGKWRNVNVEKSTTGTTYTVYIGGGIGLMMSQRAWERAVIRGDAIQAGIVTSNKTATHGEPPDRVARYLLDLSSGVVMHAE